MRNLIIN